MQTCHLLQVFPPNVLLTHFSEWKIPYELSSVCCSSAFILVLLVNMY